MLVALVPSCLDRSSAGEKGKLAPDNAALVAKAAREFKVPTILTTVAEKTFSGPLFDEIKSVFGKR